MFTHMHFRYDIISATFDCVDVDRYKCEVTDPHDVSVSTSATLNDGVMRQHLQSGDVLRVEVVSASIKHVFVRIPRCLGFMPASCKDDLTKPIAIMDVDVFGYFNKETTKFVSRPFAVEFLHIMHRHFHFATMSTRSGMTLSSKLFGPYPLVFVSEDTVYEQLQDRPWIDDQNSFILGVCDDDDNECDMIPHRMTVSTYTKQNCNDDVLGPHTDLLKFLLSVSDKSNMGIHIDQYNE